MVEPYWAPGTEIKVCAYDAQEAEAMRGEMPDVFKDFSF